MNNKENNVIREILDKRKIEIDDKDRRKIIEYNMNIFKLILLKQENLITEKEYNAIKRKLSKI